ncbi:MAG: hypothetical protein Q8934_10830 [Bacillota bacterium]|nr:hypothetical protein [Bacillota bacterium]
MKQNLMKIIEELSFSSAESDAFLKSIQIMKDSQNDESINPIEMFQKLVKEVVDNAI